MTRYPCVAILAALAAGVVCNLHADDRDESAEVIVEWNELLQQNTPPTAALASFRYYVMLHIAMFDAVNAIAREYTPYRVRLIE